MVSKLSIHAHPLPAGLIWLPGRRRFSGLTDAAPTTTRPGGRSEALPSGTGCSLRDGAWRMIRLGTRNGGNGTDEMG